MESVPPTLLRLAEVSTALASDHWPPGPEVVKAEVVDLLAALSDGDETTC
jgi:hypothetical protein